MKKNALLLTLITLGALCLTGCTDPLDKYEFIFDRYYATTLKVTTSADILATTQDPDTELLSQSESVVAVWGKEGNKDRTHWFNMIAFDEDAMTAARNYGFILEETNIGFNRTPRPALRFDAEVIIDAGVLDAPYANNNEKYIAVLKEVSSLFNKDAAELTYDSAQFNSSVIMAQQAFKTLHIKLMQSPAYAAQLPRLQGLEFDHMNLGESRIRMIIEGDIVKVKIKCSKKWFQKTPFEEQPDVIHM